MEPKETGFSTIHVGDMIKKHLDNNNIYKSALAQRLSRDDSAIIRYQKNASLKSSILIKISDILQHNFFADIAAQLPATYSTNVNPDTQKDERIAQLEQENAILKAESAILLKAIHG